MRTWLFALAVVGLIAVTVQAKKIRIPKHYPNIQTAINFAADGDVVIVSDGVWTGRNNKNLDTFGLAITIRSKNGPENCIIDCEGDGRGFWFHTQETETTRVIGFTIRNGSAGDGGGILCAGTTPEIVDCTFISCHATGDGGAIESVGSLIRDCRFSNNSASSQGGAIWSAGSIIDRCVFEENTAAAGGAMYDNRANTITNCLFLRNSTTGRGGAVQLENSTVSNCLFVENTAKAWGGAIRHDGGNPDVSNVTFLQNSSQLGGGFSGGGANITNAIFWDNSPDQLAGYPRVSYSDIQGNWPGPHNIDAEPLFVAGPLGDLYLSHKKAGQERNSPCRNGGLGTAKELGLKKTTTRTDGKKDKKAVDMGYHYPR